MYRANTKKLIILSFMDLTVFGQHGWERIRVSIFLLFCTILLKHLYSLIKRDEE